MMDHQSADETLGWEMIYILEEQQMKQINQ